MDMDEYIRKCNAYKPDLAVSIHFNAGGGQGFEVYHSVVGGTSKKLAENINVEASKLMKSRGIKTKTQSDGRDYFGVIRETYAPAVLVEGGFVDNKSDADYIKFNYKMLAKAYADGIAKTLGVSKKSMELSSTSTNPIQNKAIYAKFNELNKEIISKGIDITSLRASNSGAHENFQK